MRFPQFYRQNERRSLVSGRTAFRRSVTLETLESRQLLAGESLVISEFMADNETGLTDHDGEASDWIEVYNPTDESVDLDGWYLTDNADDLTKWQITNLTIGADRYQNFFASGKDVLPPRQDPHTNFKLGSGGEYLALVRPDLSIAHEYAPEFPAQKPDISYGLPTVGFDFLAMSEQIDMNVPLDNSLGLAWTEIAFQNTPGEWTPIILPVGHGIEVPDLSVSGFTVRQAHSSQKIGSLEAADALLAGTDVISETTTVGMPVINLFDAGKDGRFEEDNGVYPDGGGGNFAIEARATLVVATEGEFTFGASVTENARLKIDGEIVLIDSGTINSAHDVLGIPVTLSAGTHSLEFVTNESNRGTEVELFVAPGNEQQFGPKFRLLGDTSAMGLSVAAIHSSIAHTDTEELLSGNNTSVYLRVPFEHDAVDTVDSLSLQIQYSDGFVAYLNGVEIARSGAVEAATWNSLATESRSQLESLSAVTFDVSAHIDLLRAGENVLAIHAMTSEPNDAGFLISPKLVGDGLFLSAPRFFDSPTPERANQDSIQGYAESPVISVSSGFFDQRLTVEISSPTPGSIIRYTTDSSEPSPTNGSSYTAPLAISTTTTLRAVAFKAGYGQSATETRSYIFLDDVLQQDGAGLPDVWGKYVNANAGQPVPANYEMDPQVVNDARYRDTIKDDLLAIPTLSLVLDPYDLWDQEDGIYSNSLSAGIEWERAVSAELISPDGESNFRVDAGLRVHGGWGRRPSQTNKHSFRLNFKDEYGPSELDYPWFGEEATDKFDTVVLRAGFNDSWAPGGNTNTSYIQDRWAAQTLQEMGYVQSHGTWVHLYLNGLYWGLYNPVERPNASFAASYFGGDKDDYDAIVTGKFIDGDNTHWNEMMALVRQPNIDYEAVKERLDIVPFIDYMIVNHFGGNWDWPHNNWYATRRREEGGKWYFHSWDAEGVLRGSGDNRVDADGANASGELYLKLRDGVEEFRMLFTERIQKHLFNGGLLTPEANLERLDRLVAPIDRAVVGESARWGDGRLDTANPPRTRDSHWIPRINNLRNSYFPSRNDTVIKQYRSSGLYPDLDAPTFTVNRDPHHGGQLDEGELLTIFSPSGRGKIIYYTLDGTDPLLPGGVLSPSALEYSEPITLSESTVVRARLKQVKSWSAAVEAQFFVNTPAEAGNLAVSEIHYNPADPDAAELAAGYTNNDDFEFIELQNTSDSVLDLAGVRLTRGVEFDFTESPVQVLQPGQRVVVVGNEQAFRIRYGEQILVAGQFLSGKLSNGGEYLRTDDRFGAVIQEFRYNDGEQWPQLADGDGRSLVVLNMTGDYDTAENWAASSEEGGSPGVAGTVAIDDSPVVTQVAISSSQWNSDLLAHLETQGLGTGGYDLSQNGDPAGTLPWSGLDELMVTFSTDMLIEASDLNLTGQSVADYSALIGSFEYDPAAFTATWIFASPIGADRIQFDLADRVRSKAGLPITDNLAVAFNVLPGDIDGDQFVDIRDIQRLRNLLTSTISDADYDARVDLNGSSDIDIRDIQILRTAMLSELPAAADELLATEAQDDQTLDPNWPRLVDSLMSQL